MRFPRVITDVVRLESRGVSDAVYWCPQGTGNHNKVIFMGENGLLYAPGVLRSLVDALFVDSMPHPENSFYALRNFEKRKKAGKKEDLTISKKDLYKRLGNAMASGVTSALSLESKGFENLKNLICDFPVPLTLGEVNAMSAGAHMAGKHAGPHARATSNFGIWSPAKLQEGQIPKPKPKPALKKKRKGFSEEMKWQQERLANNAKSESKTELRERGALKPPTRSLAGITNPMNLLNPVKQEIPKEESPERDSD